MSEHSKLPPSSAARRVACPGSRYLESLYPREESDAAKEGTLAHAFASDRLNRRIRVLKGYPFPTPEPELPKGMEDHVMLYVEYVYNEYEFNFLGKNGPIDLHVEERLDISSIHPECWGTPDAWFVANEILHMFDFKYGFGYVDEFKNWQMIEYAAGIKEPFNLAVFHIIQPRCYADKPIRTWAIDTETLKGHWETLKEVEQQAISEGLARTRPSEECVNCKARHACPALQKTVLNNINEDTLSIPKNLDEAALGNELRILHNAAKLLDARITGLEEEALAKLKAGKRIPHYEMGEVQSRERWARDAKDILALGEVFGIKLDKPSDVEFITPKQAIKAGIPANIVRNYSETPTGAKKLVAIDEKKLRKIFGDK